MAGWSQTLSPGTMRLVVQTLRSVFSAASKIVSRARSPVARLSFKGHKGERLAPLFVIDVQPLSGHLAFVTDLDLVRGDGVTCAE